MATRFGGDAREGANTCVLYLDWDGGDSFGSMEKARGCEDLVSGQKRNFPRLILLIASIGNSSSLDENVN